MTSISNVLALGGAAAAISTVASAATNQTEGGTETKSALGQTLLAGVGLVGVGLIGAVMVGRGESSVFAGIASAGLGMFLGGSAAFVGASLIGD